jgi:hypothetical protein
MLGSSLVATELVASQVVLSSEELISFKSHSASWRHVLPFVEPKRSLHYEQEFTKFYNTWNTSWAIE